MKSATAADGSTPELAARLLALTGDPQYAAALNHAPVMAAWLTGVLYSRAAGGISLNVYAPSQTMIGPVHLAEQVQPVAQPGSGRKITVIVKVAHPTKFTLYVFVPADATHLSSPNHPKPTSVPADHYVVLTRRWKSGDKVILTS